MIRNFVITTWDALRERFIAPRQGALLLALSIAVEKQLPLVPVLEAFAEDSHGRWRVHALQLADMLREGDPLADALETLQGVVPAPAVLAARVGSESGTLGPALRLAAETFTNEKPYQYGAVSSLLIYLSGLTGAMISITGFVMYYIIPKFKKIFADFGTELPDSTTTLINVSDAAVSLFPLHTPLVFIAVALAIFFFVYGSRSLARWPYVPRFWPWLRGPEILRAIVVAVEAGRPVTTALATLESAYPDQSVRRRLVRVKHAAEAGDDVWHSLMTNGIIRHTDAVVLEAAQRAGNLPWVLRHLANNIENRANYRLLLFLESARPILLIAFGVLVGSIVIALFMPLIKLLNDLS